MTRRKVVSGDPNGNNNTSAANPKKRQRGLQANQQAQISKATSNKRQQSPPSSRGPQNDQQQQSRDQEPVWIYGLINNIEQMLSQFNAANHNQRLQQVVVQQQQQQQQQQQELICAADRTSGGGGKSGGKCAASVASRASQKARSSTTSSGYSTPSSLYSSASLSPPFSSSSSFNSTSNSPTSSTILSQEPQQQSHQPVAMAPSCVKTASTSTKSNQQQQQQQIPRSPISRQIKFHEYKGPPQARKPANAQKQPHQQQVQPAPSAINATNSFRQGAESASSNKTISEPITSTKQPQVNPPSVSLAVRKSPDCMLMSPQEQVQPPPVQQQMTSQPRPMGICLEHVAPEPLRSPPQQKQHQQQQILADIKPLQQQQVTFNAGAQLINGSQTGVGSTLRQQQQQQPIQIIASNSGNRLILSSSGIAQVSLIRQQQQQHPRLMQQPMRSCQLIQQQQSATICFENRRQSQQQQHVSLQMIRTPNGGQQQVLVLDPIPFQQMQQNHNQHHQHHHQQQQQHQCHLYNQQYDQKPHLISVDVQHPQQQQLQAPILPHNQIAPVQEQQQPLQSNGFNALINNNDNFYTQPQQQVQQTQGSVSVQNSIGQPNQLIESAERDIIGYDESQHQQQQLPQAIISHIDSFNNQLLAPLGQGPISEGTTEAQAAGVNTSREFMIDAYDQQQDLENQQMTAAVMPCGDDNSNQYQQQQQMSYMATAAGDMNHVVAGDLNAGDQEPYELVEQEDDTSEIEPTISFGGEHCNGQLPPFDENLLFSEFIDLQDIPLNVDESDWLRKFLPPPCPSSSGSNNMANSATTTSTSFAHSR